mmetsp:Transcript_57845/g.126788  ORF Transcript_57845/g.126788 Transcript_57845/m.126788 type:complete len:205 (-) Transcript_57845:436-1050(-)
MQVGLRHGNKNTVDVMAGSQYITLMPLTDAAKALQDKMQAEHPQPQIQKPALAIHGCVIGEVHPGQHRPQYHQHRGQVVPEHDRHVILGASRQRCGRAEDGKKRGDEHVEELGKTARVPRVGGLRACETMEHTGHNQSTDCQSNCPNQSLDELTVVLRQTTKIIHRDNRGLLPHPIRLVQVHRNKLRWSPNRDVPLIQDLDPVL